MTRDQAISYLYSSGMSNEQVKAVVEALSQADDDAISRQAVIDITWEEPSYTDALNVLTEVRDKVKALPSVNPQPICEEREKGECPYYAG